MHKLPTLVLFGVVLAALSYQLLAADSMAVGDAIVARQEMEIVTRNAAIAAFTEAKLLVKKAADPTPFLGEGVRIDGVYEGAPYTAHIVSGGHTVEIQSRAEMTSPTDTVDFAVAAEVVWNAQPEGGSPNLVLRAYHEQ